MSRRRLAPPTYRSLVRDVDIVERHSVEFSRQVRDAVSKMLRGDEPALVDHLETGPERLSREIVSCCAAIATNAPKWWRFYEGRRLRFYILNHRVMLDVTATGAELRS